MSKQKKAKCVSQKLKRLVDKVKKLVNELEELDSIRTEFIEGGSRQEEQEEKGFSIGRKAVVRRRNKPTGQGCVESTGQTRRMETMLAANAIHGGSKDDTKPGAIGMLETLENKCKVGDIVKGLEKCSKFKSKVFSKIYKEDLKKFERSDENMLRSIAVYYSKGVMGKEKYRRVYKASSYEQICGSKRAKRVSVAKCPTTRLVPYDRLMQSIKSIDIGKLFSIREHLCNGLDKCEKVNGFYRDIEDILVKLAEFYLNIGKYKLFNFNQPNSFHVAIGGDGAPFGRDDSACSWLVSFLNIGHGMLSRNENFLLFGANCSENCLPVIAYSNHSTEKQLFNNCFLIWHLLFL
ncbi:uncharacterized protein LOC124454489 [Xenia sp. Carnegie-2017]|uniref:uncharacterized protein LOC124454489 n=1 Tax=Xenia sp. Carnegie-2017 TaxID=2897299 RepID=UPI001F045AB4|nr:uncharacterized protein LOC124454489 [Xenia sp. Carnegie-2017]